MVFPQNLKSLGMAIWKSFSINSTSIQLDDCNQLIGNTQPSAGDGLSLLKDLFDENMTAADLASIISWSCFGHMVDDDLVTAMLKPLQTLFNSESFSKEDLFRRLKTNYPEVGSDLMQVVRYWLKGELIGCPLHFTAASPFTDLLRWDIFWLLSFILSAPFKILNSSRLPKGPPLEIEQLAHLTCLYNSAVDGFSFTKIKEMAFDYTGPLILLLSTRECLFCLASGDGLRDSMTPYGGDSTILFRILPDFAKLVSGRLSSTATNKNEKVGVIHSNFTAKTIRRGLLVGHQPVLSPAVAVNDDFTEIAFAGGPPNKLVAVEAWAAGTAKHLTDLKSYKSWELKEVTKEKNRKIKLYSQWQDSADRSLLELAGISVHHSQALPPVEEPPAC